METEKTIGYEVPVPPVVGGLRLKIGVMGDASGLVSDYSLEMAVKLGAEIARRGCILITGGCAGLPLAAADGAKRLSGLVVGISPGLSLQEHIYKYESPVEGHDLLIFTGSGLMGREIVNIRSSDIIVIIGGRSGTLGELAIAYDEGKLIGVVLETGGISDIIPSILGACNKDTGSVVIYDKDPVQLIARLIETYMTSHYRHPSCFSGIEGGTQKSGHRTARDVVCGMWVDPLQCAYSHTHDGQKYHFCCAHCLNEFLRTPTGFIRTGKRLEAR